jgi:hypothetical protein
MNRTVDINSLGIKKLRLTAYPKHHVVELAMNGEKTVVPLISVSNTHARLAANGKHGRFKVRGGKASLDLRMGGKALPCEVSWVEDNEIEVAFARALPFSVTEMQQGFSKAA